MPEDKIFRIMLAPMEGWADAKVRADAYRNGADLTFTEMARVGNLVKKKAGELRKINIPDNTPTQIQLAGSKIEEYEKFLSEFEPKGGFCGFNLNLGCSSPSFVRQGIGAAMIKRVTRTNEIVNLIKISGYECSIKMRLGLNQYEKERGAYLNLISNIDASFFVVHARTADQTLEDPPDNSVYARCKKTGKKIIANGNIAKKEQINKLEQIGLDGAMIGRAAKVNPLIFSELKK